MRNSNLLVFFFFLIKRFFVSYGYTSVVQRYTMTLI